MSRGGFTRATTFPDVARLELDTGGEVGEFEQVCDDVDVHCFVYDGRLSTQAPDAVMRGFDSQGREVAREALAHFFGR
jgi:hypothetical protein